MHDASVFGSASIFGLLVLTVLTDLSLPSLFGY